MASTYDHAYAEYWKDTLAGVSLTFAILPTIVFCMRVYASHMISHRYRADDILMGCAVVLMWGNTASVLLKAFNGIGVPKEYLPQENQRLLNLGSWLIIKFWASSMACVKVSICLFLRRLMLGQDRVRNAFNVVIVFVICWACVPFFYTIFFCSPVAYYWDRTIEGGSCVDDDQYILESILSGVISLVTDLIILMLPMPSIWHLKISFKKKVAVTCILCVGVILLRCVQFAYFDTAHLSTSSNLESLWTILENDFAILCGCMPQLRPLFRRVFDDSRPDPNPSYGSYRTNRNSIGSRFWKMGVSGNTIETNVATGSRTTRLSGSRSESRSEFGHPSSDLELEGIQVQTTIDHEVERLTRVADSLHDHHSNTSIV